MRIAFRIVLIVGILAATGRLLGAEPPKLEGYTALTKSGFESVYSTPYQIYVSTQPIDGSKPLMTPAVPAGWAVYAGPVPTVLDEPARALLVIRQVKVISLPPATVPVDPPPARPDSIDPPAGYTIVRAGDRLPELRPGLKLALEHGGRWEHETTRGKVLPRLSILPFGDPRKPAPVLHSSGTVLEIWDSTNVEIVGVRFEGRGSDKPGLRFVNSSRVDVIRCTFTGFSFGITVEGTGGKRCSDLVVSGSRVFDNGHDGGGDASGIFVSYTDGIRIEGNLFDRNGWTGRSRAKGSLRNHHVYVHATCTGLVARNNVLSRSASHGIQARPGGTIEGNVFIDCPIALSFGHVNGDGPVTAGGVVGSVKNNVFIGGGSIEGFGARGWAIDAGNLRQASIEGNAFADGTHGSPAIRLVPCVMSDKYKGPQPVGVRQLTIADNRQLRWPGELLSVNRAAGVAGGQPVVSGNGRANGPGLRAEKVSVADVVARVRAGAVRP
jgi:hypothetical protein